MNEYTVIIASSTPDLIKQVNEHLKQGWVRVEGLVIDAQAKNRLKQVMERC